MVDPINENEGFFIWRKGKPVQTKYFWLNGEEKTGSDEFKTLEKRLSEKIEVALEKERPQAKNGLKIYHLYMGVFLLMVILAIVGYLIRSDVNTHFKSQQNYISQLFNQLFVFNEESKASTPEAIIKILNENNGLSGLQLNLRQRGKTVWISGEVYTWKQKELIGKLTASVDGVIAVDVSNVFVTHQYITMHGETLSGIAWKVYGNPERWKDIFALNRDIIKDPLKLQPFCRLRLPE